MMREIGQWLWLISFVGCFVLAIAACDKWEKVRK